LLAAEEAARLNTAADTGDDVGAPAEMPTAYVRAIYPYAPENLELGPDEMRELDLVEGTHLALYSDGMDEDGFFVGENLEGHQIGERGMIPSNFVEEVEEFDVPEELVARIGGAATGDAGPGPGGDADLDMVGLPEIEAGKHYTVLHDYDPATNSTGDAEEELELVQGMIIEAVEDMMEDGYFLARREDGREGLVPSNFVAELTSSPAPEPNPDVFPNGTVVLGLYDYSPEDHSPNEDDDVVDELSFAAGDKMVITGEMDEDGFYTAEHKITGRTGLIPSNFVEAESPAAGATYTNFEDKLSSSSRFS